MIKHLQTKLMLLVTFMIAGAASAWADEETITVSSVTITSENFNITAAKGSGSNIPTYNTSDEGLRLYPKNTLAISSKHSETIKEIEFTVKCNTGGSNKVYPTGVDASVGTVSGTPGASTTSITWSGNSTEVTFTIQGSAGNIAFKSIKITYETSDLKDCPITLDKTSLELDVYSNKTRQLVATSASTGTITWVSSNEYVATVADDGTVTALRYGKATITAKQAADETYNPGSVSCEVTVLDSTPFESGDVTFTSGTDKGSTNATGTPDEVIILPVIMSCTDAAFATNDYRFYKGSILTFTATTGKITKIAFTGVKNYPISNLKVQDSNGSLTASGNDGTWKGSSTEVKFEASEAQARATKVVVTVELDEEPLDLSFTISSAEWKTLVAPATVSMPTGVDAYIVTKADASSVTLTDVTVLTKGTPFIVWGEEGSYTMDEADEEDLAYNDVDLSANLLQISDGTTTTKDNNTYVLANKNDQVGFYRWTGDASLSAGRVYLQIADAAREFIGFDAEATGISEVAAQTDAALRVYTLGGQRVARPAQGLFIVGGKKMIVK